MDPSAAAALQALTADLGGSPENPLPEAKALIVRHDAGLEAELSQLLEAMAKQGRPNPKRLDLYGRMVNTLRRQLEALGLERIARDISPPSLRDYLRQGVERGAERHLRR